jgi:molybdate transport system ATP-binding protein
MKLSARLKKSYPASPESAGFTLDVELEVEPGVTVLFGASGAGKSLTLDCLAGFARPDDGQILLGNRILFDAPTGVNVRPQQRECGYVFQNHALFPHMTIRENLAFAAERRPRLERHRRVTEMMERFQLGEIAGRKPREVSGGQKQRCSIARALIAAPQLLLFDEPARGLDAGLRGDFFALVRELRADLKIPLLLVTHDLDEAVAVGDRMLVYREGRIVQSGLPQSVISRPATVEIARLVGHVNVLPVEILALDPGRNTSRLRVWTDGLGKQEISGPYFPGHLLGDRIQVMIRADDVRIHSHPGENRIAVKLSAKLEHARLMELQFGGDLTALTPRHEFESRRDASDWYVELPPLALKLPGTE